MNKLEDKVKKIWEESRNFKDKLEENGDKDRSRDLIPREVWLILKRKSEGLLSHWRKKTMKATIWFINHNSKSWL